LFGLSDFYRILHVESTWLCARSVLKSLGLGRKIGRPVFQPHNAAAAGKILKVKELVKVENMTGPIPPQGFQRTRATKGYKVVGKMI